MQRSIALLPVGCTEAHGHLPPDTDTLIARAFCKLAGERVPAAVERPVEDGFCPSTCALAGTKVVRFAEVFREVAGRVHRLIEAGRRHIVLVNIHAGNEPVLRGVVGDVYVERGFPLFYFNPYTAFAQELDAACFPQGDNNLKECSLLHAGLAILGMEPIAGPPVDEEAERDPAVEKLRRFGTLGFTYRLAPQHVAGRAGALPQTGRRYLEQTAQRFAPLARAFEQYVERELSCRRETNR